MNLFQADTQRPSIETVSAACEAVAAGKQAARQIKGWIQGWPLSEVEFRLLWELRSRPPDQSIDQARLACALAVSTAQVSASVERLRTTGLVTLRSDPSDRRRQCWSLSPAAVDLLAEITACPASDARPLPPEAA